MFSYVAPGINIVVIQSSNSVVVDHGDPFAGHLAYGGFDSIDSFAHTLYVFIQILDARVKPVIQCSFRAATDQVGCFRQIQYPSPTHTQAHTKKRSFSCISVHLSSLLPQESAYERW